MSYTTDQNPVNRQSHLEIGVCTGNQCYEGNILMVFTNMALNTSILQLEIITKICFKSREKTFMDLTLSMKLPMSQKGLCAELTPSWRVLTFHFHHQHAKKSYGGIKFMAL